MPFILLQRKFQVFYRNEFTCLNCYPFNFPKGLLIHTPFSGNMTHAIRSALDPGAFDKLAVITRAVERDIFLFCLKSVGGNVIRSSNFSRIYTDLLRLNIHYEYCFIMNNTTRFTRFLTYI